MMGEPIVVDISFEPVQPAHYDLLREWLETPEWRRWWGDPDEEFGLIVEMVEGRDATRPFIFYISGKPTGYIQYWFIGPHQTPYWIEKAPWLASLPADAIGVDLSIGDAREIGRGIGSRVLRAFAERLSSDGHGTIVIDPDVKNLRAKRAYLKAGFRPIPGLQETPDGCSILRYQPNEHVRAA